jgi:hypothetical protein
LGRIAVFYERDWPIAFWEVVSTCRLVTASSRNIETQDTRRLLGTTCRSGETQYCSAMTMSLNSGLGHRSGGKRPAISKSMCWRMGRRHCRSRQSVYRRSEDAPGV